MKLRKKCYCILILIPLLFSLCSCSNSNNNNRNNNSNNNSSNNNGSNNSNNNNSNNNNSTNNDKNNNVSNNTDLHESIPIGTRTNPLPLNTTVLFNGSNTLYDTYTAEITLLDIIRGPDAIALAMSSNQYNNKPADGKEYLFARFRIRALDSENDAMIDINNSSFTLVSEDGKAYDNFTTVSGIKPSLKEMYAGGTQEGYACFEVNVEDTNPSIVFLERNNNDIWFTTNQEASLAEGSTVYVPPTDIPSPDTTNAAIGTRLNPYPLNTTASFNGMDTLFDTYQADIKLKEVIRGDSAMDIIANASNTNELPQDDQEYLLARFEVNATNSKDDAKIEISSANFELVSEDGIKYDDFVSISNLEPKLTTMYKGNVQEGYAYFLVNKKDKHPLIVFLERDHHGLWFSTTK